MTDTNCWLAYKRLPDENDVPALASAQQAEPEHPTCAHYASRFPSVFRNGWYWTSALRRWCDSSGIPYVSEDGGTLITASVTKAQAEAFIAFVYDADPDYTDPVKVPLRPERLIELASLKAGMAENTDPDAIYELKADEW